jgi:hypothetical protein
MERLTRFVGTWDLEAVFAPPAHPVPAPTGVGGRTVFEWALGGQFLVQRSQVDAEEAPDGLCVIAQEGEAFRQHYFDSRGVVRLYGMSFRDGVWILRRTTPDFSPLSFGQRFTGRFSDDDARIDGRWESSHDGGSSWELDFELNYTRTA